MTAQYTQYKKLAFFFVAPQVIVTLVFFIWPAFLAMMQSVFFADAFGIHKQFSGLSNYSDLLQDSRFWQALWVTLLIAFFVTIVTMSLGLLLAYLVSNRGKSKSLYKLLLLWPYAIAPAMAAILWRLMCQPKLGWLSQGFLALGLDFNYLIHPKQALLVIILTASWQQFSYNFLFFWVALKALPKSLFEAAILDGASKWRLFWQIIFPLISPTSFFLLVINILYAFFDTFGIIDVLTHGGPENTTTTLMYKVYQDGFVGMDLGSSAALSVMLMFLVVGLTLIQFRVLEKKVHYL